MPIFHLLPDDRQKNRHNMKNKSSIVAEHAICDTVQSHNGPTGHNERYLSSAHHFAFGSKAATLQALASRIRYGRVLPLLRFTVEQWNESPNRILEEARVHFGERPLIVRSSSLAEDTDASSTAGCYCSELNVRGRAALSAAIAQVIRSYGTACAADEVFIQPMAEQVLVSGVAMTSDPNSGLPYYVVNYTMGDDTAAVTSGERSVQGFSAYKKAPVVAPPELEALFPLLQELEQLTGRSALDIEFAIDSNGPVLFQVRPMTALDKSSGAEHGVALLHTMLNREVERVAAEHPFIIPGRQQQGALFGVMPDWNPAEMIGIKPRPLAYSLYKEIITDVNWASARFRYGYRDLRDRQLMTQFCGTPYIYIPRSVESFIPAALPEDVVDAVRDACCAYLAANRHLHDKIEFAVMPTCYTPSLELDDSQFREAFARLTARQRALYITELKHVTEHVISLDGPFFNDLKLMPSIRQRIEELVEVPDDGLHAFRQALHGAKVVGEVFAGAARAAFIATAILKSVERLGRVDRGFTDVLISSIRTVGRQVSDDFKVLDKVTFLRRHGHIRPGTYDIRVQRYDEDPDTYFDWDANIDVQGTMESHPSVERRVLRALEKTFKECAFGVSADHFLRFAMTAIAAREKVKYLYGALVSEALKRLTRWGARHGFSRDELSFLTLSDLEYVCETTGADLRTVLESNRRSWNISCNIRVPDIICRPEELLSHASSAAHPNFITQSTTEAAARVLALGAATGEAISDTIVLIESADPGFDWIFTHRIRGFITAYGGENSHMSIRAREFAVPAAIGVGDARFRALCGASRLRLDCAGQRIQVLQ